MEPLKKLWPATVALLAEVAQREDELKGADLGRPRTAADTAMALRSVLGEPGVHDLSIQRAARQVLGLTSIRTAFGVLRAELEKRAPALDESSPSPASPASPASKRSLARDGSYGQHVVFVEDGAPTPAPSLARDGGYPRRDVLVEDGAPNDYYEQHGTEILNGRRRTKRGGDFVPDIRKSPAGIKYHLLRGERSPYPLSSAFEEEKIHKGLAGLEAERERRAGAARHARLEAESSDSQLEAAPS